METIQENEVEKQLEIFLKTFGDSEEDKKKAVQIINYISRMLNDKTLRGYIEHEFSFAVQHAAKGLWSICFLEQMKFPEFYFHDEMIKLSSESGYSIEDIQKNSTLLNEVYRKYYERMKKENYSFEHELIHAKAIWKSSFTLMYLLFTRIQKGRDYELLKAEIESRKPVMVSK